MAKKNLIDGFGTAATQTETYVTLDKSALSSQGLTNTASNTVQSIIAALVKFWALNFNAPNRTANPDETVVVTYDGQTSRTEGGNVYRVDTYRIQLYKLTPPIEADPDDY